MPQEPTEAAGSSARHAAHTRRRLRADWLPRLVARSYACSPAALRAQMIECLLRPLGPLGVAAVASGAFLGHLLQARPDGIRVAIGATARHSADQVLELARFAEQVNPDVLQQLATMLADAPLSGAGLSVAALLLFVRQRRHARPAQLGKQASER